jgi:hypothetical protein
MGTTTFRTEAEIIPSKERFEVNDTIMLIGSCFVDSVGERLSEGLLPVLCNPYGTVYNPIAIKYQLERIMKRHRCDDREIICSAGMWHSLYAHSRLSAPNPDSLKERINHATDIASDALAKAKCLIVTFGTAWMYRLKSTGEIVANCHKRPANEFERELFSADDIIKEWSPLITSLINYNKKIRIIFTVSPIRHLKETLHGNQISKATLLLSIDKLLTDHSNVDYFPSYEIMLDDLRDYRFYADDMVHPSKTAVDYIYDLFAQNYLSSTAKSFVNEAKKISQALCHRNMGNDEAYRQFMMATYERSQAIKKKYKVSDCNHNYTLAVEEVARHINI